MYKIGDYVEAEIFSLMWDYDADKWRTNIASSATIQKGKLVLNTNGFFTLCRFDGIVEWVEPVYILRHLTNEEIAIYLLEN